MKKKVLSVTLAASLAVTSFASLAAVASAEGDTTVYTVPYSCGFESEDERKDWTLVDKDGDGENWYLYPRAEGYEDRVHSGSYAMTSASYIDYALTPDNWMISPAIKIESDSELSFWARGQDPNYVAEVFAVYISESPDVDSMTKIGGDYTATGEYVNYTFDLSGYEGKNCYIAIRHYNITDLFRLNIDDFEVRKLPVGTPAAATYAQAGEDYTSETETDNIASLWSIEVTPGDDAITSLGVKVKDNDGTFHGTDEVYNTPAISEGTIVAGIVVNHAAADVAGITAVVNRCFIEAVSAAQ